MQVCVCVYVLVSTYPSLLRTLCFVFCVFGLSAILVL